MINQTNGDGGNGSETRAHTAIESLDLDPDRLAQPVSNEAPPKLSFPVVGIGGSAGGLEAFIDLFTAMPNDTGMAFVIVQHLPPDRESLIAEILGKRTLMPVLAIEDGMKVEPNHVYIIRPGRTLMIKDGVLLLGEFIDKPGHRRPVDDFFRTLAAEQRERAIAIIMSGMGSNGTAGAQTIKAVGGMCIAQDPESAKFPSMPRSLIDNGLADFVLQPKDIPEMLLRYSEHPYASGELVVDAVAQRDKLALNDILAVLRARLRHDFSGYKVPTLIRRIQRRMGLNQVTLISDYLRLLRQQPSEATALADDLMIHVTGFFRDAEVWDALVTQVIQPLVRDRPDHGSIRAWITACSSGEEAYTLAMLITEQAERVSKQFDVKVFATDTAERSLGKARAGVYPGGIESEITPERLDRWFTREDASYRIKREVREMVVFAPQNVLQDPPFSRLDICTCRNLLIYLEPKVQKRVLSLLHFGLREGGALLLGTSETVSGSEDLFEAIDKRLRIYRRIGATRHGTIEFPLPRGWTTNPRLDAVEARGQARLPIAEIAQRSLLTHLTPPAVVIDRSLRIVYFHGDTEPFLDQPRGEPTRELMVLAREHVRGAIRRALNGILAEGAAEVAVKDGIVNSPAGAKRVTVTVTPLEERLVGDYFIVAFIETPEAPTLPAGVSIDSADFSAELARARDELHSAVEELQTSNEELKASNEEITSINEEMQSTNEELETSKEELQSLNEELTTVNSQLQAKMEELETTTNDLASLLSSTTIAVVFLDTQFRVRRFTPAVKELIELIPSDIGRPISDLAKKFRDDRLLEDGKTVLETLVPAAVEIRSHSGRIFQRRLLPYRTGDNRINGVVITFVDITELKEAEGALRESNERHSLVMANIQEYAIFMYGMEGRISDWSLGATQVTQFTEQEALGMPVQNLFTQTDRAAGIPEREMEQAGLKGRATDERWHVRKDGTTFWGSGMVSAVHDERGSLCGFVKVMRDGTQHRRNEEALLAAKHAAEVANDAKDVFLATVSHELRTPLASMLLWAKILTDYPNNADQVRQGLEAISRGAESQRELIEDLLDTSRISSGKLRLEQRPVDLQDIVNAAVQLANPTAAIKGVTLTAELSSLTAVVDPSRVQQICGNLLSNAVKFTDKGGSIHVTMTASDAVATIAVRDSGVGITPAFLPRVFDRFGQADSSTRRTVSGLGLGLSIAKQLVEMHGGMISVASEGTGMGATFTVTLPLASEAASTASVSERRIPSQDLSGVRILLVEDDALARQAMTILLQRAGMAVTTAPDVPTALETFQQQPADFIISDIALPGENGLSFISKLRAWERSHGSGPVPAVALTAYANDRDLHLAIDQGFQRYLAKPVNPTELIGVVAALLSER